MSQFSEATILESVRQSGLNVESESDDIISDSQADSSWDSEVVDDTDDDPTFDPNVAGPSSGRPRHTLYPLARPNLQTFESHSSDEEENPPQAPRPRPEDGRSRPVAGRARPRGNRARGIGPRGRYQTTLQSSLVVGTR